VEGARAGRTHGWGQIVEDVPAAGLGLGLAPGAEQLADGGEEVDRERGRPNQDVALPADVDRAFAVGRQGFARWSRVSVEERAATLDKLADLHKFQVPEGLVEGEFNAIWARIEEAKKNGQKVEDDEEKMRQEYREIAERRVRLGPLLADVGRPHSLEVTPEDIRIANKLALHVLGNSAEELSARWGYRAYPLDELAAARTGMMPILPQPGEPPVYTGAGQMYSSVTLALGVMLAIHHRTETGEGQRVDISLFGGKLDGANLGIQA